MKQYDPRAEYNVGDVFEYDGNRILCIEDGLNDTCKGCAFEHEGTDGDLPCLYCTEKDVKFIIFEHKDIK